MLLLTSFWRFTDVGEDLEPQAQRHQIPWLEITKGSSINRGDAILLFRAIIPAVTPYTIEDPLIGILNRET